VEFIVAFQRKKMEAIGVKAPLPGFVKPALASSIAKVPSGERWIHEIKFDGYRVQVHLANEAVKIFTRRGHDWTHRFKKVAHDAWHIKAGSAVIDGEIVVPAADGTTDFAVLQNELKGKSASIVLVAFDLLHLNGRDLRTVPLFQRKADLKKIMGQEDLRAAGNADHRRIRAGRLQVGRAVRRPPQGRRSCLRRQGRPRLRQGLGRRPPQAPRAARPEDAGLREAGRAQGHLGRAEAAGRDRVPGEVGGGKSAAPVFQRTAGGPMMDAYDQFWRWAEKPLESPLTLPADLHQAVMELAPEDRRDRGKVN
jgi:hypothetical protein